VDIGLLKSNVIYILNIYNKSRGLKGSKSCNKIGRNEYTAMISKIQKLYKTFTLGFIQLILEN